MTELLIEDVEVEGRAGLSVWIKGAAIHAIRPREQVAPAVGTPAGRIDGRGAALLAGLHDHHIHLFAAAARAASVWCGEPGVTSPAFLRARIAQAARDGSGGGWVRAVGWDDTVAGWPDRSDLDAAVPDRPLRLQHRSGAMWVLNSEALARVGLTEGGALPKGVEVGPDGRPTGRLAGLDGWLRERVGGDAPHLGSLSADLASRGVTGVTDATAHNGPTELAALAAARRAGDLLQGVTAMVADPGTVCPEGLKAGPVKLVLLEPALPSIAELAGHISRAHAADWAVAVHAASRVQVLLSVAALAEAGALPGDRIEHASVVPDEMLDQLADLGVTIVTQPHFIAENGDRYLSNVEQRDLPFLYRGRAFLDAGIPLAAGSDAPVGDPDPWSAMAAAVSRETAGGSVVEPGERLTPEEALCLFTGSPSRPGGPPRRVVPGAPADLCLIDRDWQAARQSLADVRVAATIIAGRAVHLSG